MKNITREPNKVQKKVRMKIQIKIYNDMLNFFGNSFFYLD